MPNTNAPKPINLRPFTPKLFSLIKDGLSLNTMSSDLVSGLTVAVVALPLSMALAIASGASPDKGLITAVIAGFLISFLGGSRVQIGGPTGAFVVVIFNVIAHHGYDGLLLATLMAGVILLIAGYAKLGQLVKFIPNPVITGFTTGIAVIIASSQIKDFLGLNIANLPAEFIPKWLAYFANFNALNLLSLGVGVLALAIILGLRKFAPKWPGYLIAIIVCSLIVSLGHLPIDTIGSRFPHIPTGIPLPSWPVFSLAKAGEVMSSAFIIAFLAGIEALLSAMVADGMTGYRHRSNQELVANGFANIASALFGGLPATGALARTATNIRAGAKTPLSGIFHALFILIFMLFAAKIMAFVPMTTLAAILFVVAWGMSEMHRFVHIVKMPGSDRVILLLTFALTVLVDLTVAIGVGVTLASLMFMARMSRSVTISTGESDEDEDLAPQHELPQRQGLPKGVEVFRISGPVFFGVAGDLMTTLEGLGQVPKVLILRMRQVPFLDATGAAAIESLVKYCAQKEIFVILSGLNPQALQLLKHHNIGDDNALEAGVLPAPTLPTHILSGSVLIAPDYPHALKRAREIIN